MDVRPGDRVRLIKMGSDPDPIEPGSTGTVESVTSGPLGQIWVKWTSNRSLALIPGIDVFALIAEISAPSATSSGKIRIPAEVLNGIEAVRLTGATNMLDRPMVIKLARKMGFKQAADWLADQANHKAYAEGIFRGFEPDQQ